MINPMKIKVREGLTLHIDMNKIAAIEEQKNQCILIHMDSGYLYRISHPYEEALKDLLNNWQPKK